MAFDKIPEVPKADDLIKFMLAEGRKAKSTKRGTVITRARTKERDRLTRISQALVGRLRSINNSFPSVNDLSEFYRELLKTKIDLDEYKERLGRVNGSTKVVHDLAKKFRGKVTASETAKQVNSVMKMYIGRTSSVAKKLNKDFTWLEKTRKFMKTFPVAKKMFTVCLAGFPNVGKTTMLQKLTGSNAEINEYAFTTKSLNLGYKKFGYRKVQFIDTPGTLNREKMNAIELQAHLALKYLADVIIYIFDPTEQYSMDQQNALRQYMEEYEKPVINYISKTDIADPEKVAGIMLDHEVVDGPDILPLIKGLQLEYYT